MNQILIRLVADWAGAGRVLLPQVEIGIVRENIMSCIEGKLEHIVGGTGWI